MTERAAAARALAALEESRARLRVAFPDPNRHGRDVVVPVRYLDRLIAAYNGLCAPLGDLRATVERDHPLWPGIPRSIRRERQRLERLRKHLPLGVLRVVDEALVRWTMRSVCSQTRHQHLDGGRG